jgi:hypothetical protein
MKARTATVPEEVAAEEIAFFGWDADRSARMAAEMKDCRVVGTPAPPSPGTEAPSLPSTARNRRDLGVSARAGEALSYLGSSTSQMTSVGKYIAQFFPVRMYSPSPHAVSVWFSPSVRVTTACTAT